MKIAISADTAIDLTKELIEENNVHTIPFEILLGDETKYDGEFTGEQIIQFVLENKVLPKTAAVNQFRLEEHFAELKKDYDAIVHFTLSSGLSCTYTNAVAAAKNFDEVYVVDSMSLSTGIGLLVLYAAKLIKEGYTAKEIFERCTARVPAVQASFELERVDYLYKGGRCSALAYIGANVFGFHPQIIVKDGKMIAGKKYRGKFPMVVRNYCRDVLEEFNTPDLSVAFVTYTTAEDEVVQIAIDALKERGFEKIYVTRAGGTITSHCGENCLGILYMNDGQ